MSQGQVPSRKLQHNVQLEGGVSGVQLRQHRMEGTRGTVCFHVMRPDGTCEDFSVWKCLAGLFPAWSKTASRPVSGAEL